MFLIVLVVVLVLVLGSLLSNILYELPLFEDDDEHDDEMYQIRSLAYDLIRPR